MPARGIQAWNTAFFPEACKDLSASGRYASASEVVRAALRLLEECEGQMVPKPVASRHCAN